MANSKVALLRYIKIARGWRRVRVEAVRVKNEVIHLTTSSSLVFRIASTPKNYPKIARFWRRIGDEPVLPQAEEVGSTVQTTANKSVFLMRPEEVRLRTKEHARIFACTSRGNLRAEIVRKIEGFDSAR
jgi:hypothetical protein